MVGVLATGGAAFAANTTVLESIIPSFQRSSTLAVAETIVPFVDLSIESIPTGGTVFVNTTVVESIVSLVPTETTVLLETTVPITQLQINSTTTVAPAGITTTTLAPAVTTTSTTLAPATAQFAYNISGVGIVTLKQDVTGLKVASVKPASGWTYESKNESATRVEIEFKNGTKEVEFRAQLLDGRIITAVTVDDGSDESAENAAKVAFEAAEKAAKAAFEAAANTAKSTCDSANTATKVACEAAAKAKKEAFEAATKAEKEAFEAATKAEKEAFEAATKAAEEEDDD